MFSNSTILVTGGTGSFGQKFIAMTLKHYSPTKMIVFSRDEMKQWEMAKHFNHDPRLRFFIGDVRDQRRLARAFDGVDYVVHAAALKIVPAAEYNPFECIKTNIGGATNIIDCALDHKVKRVIALSTDKACNPINLYGATKLCSDKLFVAANSYVGTYNTRFSVVRYGNVMGSRGSVIPYFLSLNPDMEFPITDERMTRFMITLEQGVELVWHAMNNTCGGEIFVKKIPSMRVVDIAKTINPNAKLKIIGTRPGEKLHEQMICAEDAPSTLEFNEHYVILPQIQFSADHFAKYSKATRCVEGFCYSSETNTRWLTKKALSAWISKECSQDPANLKVKNTNTNIEPYETLLVEMISTLPTDSIEYALSSSMVKLLEYRKDQEVLDTIGRLVTNDRDLIPEYLVLKAIAQLRLGDSQNDFLKTVQAIDQSCANAKTKNLLSKISKAIRSETELAFS